MTSSIVVTRPTSGRVSVIRWKPAPAASAACCTSAISGSSVRAMHTIRSHCKARAMLSWCRARLIPPTGSAARSPAGAAPAVSSMVSNAIRNPVLQRKAGF
jgi:hypothetical protein